MKKSPLFIIFFVVFIDLVGFGIVVPILPYYAESLGASATVLGFLMMSYSAMQFLFAPFWGRLSDRIGRRPVILVCIAGLGLGMILLGFAHSLAWLFAARLLSGFFGANISAASAYIADVTPPEKRAKGMGMIGAAFGLGFLFGPALGGLASHWGYGTAAFLAGGFSVVNFIFAIFMLKEPNLTSKVRESHRHAPRLAFVKETLAHEKTGLAVFLFFLITLGMAQLETVFGLFLLFRFKLDAMHAGLILALLALVMVGIQGGGIGKLVKSFGETKLVMFGCVLMALSLGIASYCFLLIFFIFFLALQSAGYSLVNPSLSSLVSRHAPVRSQGATLGIYQSAGSLGRILGPIFAGFLFDHMGIEVPFLAASILFFLSFFIVNLRGKVWQG